MELPVASAPGPSPLATHERALGNITTARVLALLYFARGVLVPITLAVILSLLIAPLVRALRRLGLVALARRTPATLEAPATHETPAAQ